MRWSPSLFKNAGDKNKQAKMLFSVKKCTCINNFYIVCSTKVLLRRKVSLKWTFYQHYKICAGIRYLVARFSFKGADQSWFVLYPNAIDTNHGLESTSSGREKRHQSHVDYKRCVNDYDEETNVSVDVKWNWL